MELEMEVEVVSTTLPVSFLPAISCPDDFVTLYPAEYTVTIAQEAKRRNTHTSSVTAARTAYILKIL